MNKVNIIGRTVKDVELRYTQSGKAVATGTIAVPRSFKNENGEIESDFIPFVIWGKQAETFANFVTKGNLVGISGSIQTRNYENNNGQRVYVTEIIVTDFTFIESKNKQQQQQQQRPQQTRQQNKKPQRKQNNSSQQREVFNELDIQDDDLPF